MGFVHPLCPAVFSVLALFVLLFPSISTGDGATVVNRVICVTCVTCAFLFRYKLP
jgi:hypothetical protein